jgi:hypothetical protein
MSKQQTIVWPDHLSVPLRAGYNYTPTDRRAKAEMEMGSRYRVLFDTDETVLNCNFILAHEQLAFFEAFEKHLLKQGTLWFKMPILTAGNIAQHTVRFRERPRVGDFKDGYAVVSMVLDVSERNTFGEAEIWLLYELGPEIFTSFNRLHEVLHVEAPGVTNLPTVL